MLGRPPAAEAIAAVAATTRTPTPTRVRMRTLSPFPQTMTRRNYGRTGLSGLLLAAGPSSVLGFRCVTLGIGVDAPEVGQLLTKRREWCAQPDGEGGQALAA